MPVKNKLTVQRFLMNLYGINISRSKNIIQTLGISTLMTFKDLPEYKKDLLNQAITHLKKQKPGLDADLKMHERSRWEKELELQTYKGLRRKQGYPIRGQRTRSNARTAKRNTIK